MNRNSLETDSGVSGGEMSGSDTYPTLRGTRGDRTNRLLKERMRRTQIGASFLQSDSAEHLLQLVDQSTENIVIVANRLPGTATQDEDGNWRLEVTAGGLVSALMGIHNMKTKWIGWPGVCVDNKEDRGKLDAVLREKNFIGVFLDKNTVDDYYNGFCNAVLWPLFHYVPPSLDLFHNLGGTSAMQKQWRAYKRANQAFANCILANYGPRDIVWLHDYHLMLCPALLKAKKPKMKVGWFLHTPFPSSEIYRTLPFREDVLRALLKADLIAFHTYDYLRHFTSSCSRVLGLEGTPHGVEDHGHLTRVVACPIGIHVERFNEAFKSEIVKSHIEQLRLRYRGRKVMLGVDRLDMIKGIPQKLLAYEKFLEENEVWRDKVLLVQIAVPSRTVVHEYQKLRSMVHEMVGRINGKFGTLTHVPIHHLDRQLSFLELVALYAVTDVALVTSLRDGMNLVSYEYVICQKQEGSSGPPGVLVLSEFAGAAQSLGAGSILVNPWDTTDMAQSIHQALNMSEEERKERHHVNYTHVTKHTAQDWADTFITELNDTHIEADLRDRQAPPQLPTSAVVTAYRDSNRRLIVLGYNATLTTAVEAPRQPRRHYDQMKALARVNPSTLKCIKELCQNPENLVIIVSGSECSKLQDQFGHLPVWLAAENGVYMRPPSSLHDLSTDWHPIFDRLPKDWMDSVQMVFEYFCERTPRSFVEKRETSLVWNFKYADMEFGRIQAMDLLQHLRTGPISNAPVEIIPGARSVEVRAVGITKGLTMQLIVGEIERLMGTDASNFEFVLCIGHFLSKDENMFSYFEGEDTQSDARLERTLCFAQTNAPDANGNIEDQQRVTYSLGSTGPLKGSPAVSFDGSAWHYSSQDQPILSPKYLYTCTVGRTGSKARYSMGGSNEVATLLEAITGLTGSQDQDKAVVQHEREELETLPSETPLC